MAEIDHIFILFKVEEQNTFFDDESMTDSELAYLFDDVRKIEDDENQTATLPSKVMLITSFNLLFILRYWW